MQDRVNGNSYRPTRKQYRRTLKKVAKAKHRRTPTPNYGMGMLMKQGVPKADRIKILRKMKGIDNASFNA
jgi:hypothetical protein